MQIRKLILLSLCFLSGWAYGDINVTQGSGKTVHTDTVNGLEYQAVKIIDGTTGGTSSATVTSAGALLTNVVNSTIGVTGSLSFTPPALTTVTFNGTGQPVTGAFFQSIQPVYLNNPSTVTFNGLTQPVNVINSTVGVVGSLSFTPPALTTVTFNGTSQPVTVVASTVGISNTGFNVNNTPSVFLTNIATVTHNGIAQPVTSTSTVVTTTWTIPVSAAFVPPALTTVTFNGTAQPANVVNSTVGVVGSLSFTPPALTTVTFNGTNQPVNVINSTVGVVGSLSFTPPALTTVTFNGTAQPVTVVASTVGITGSISNTGFNVNNAPTVTFGGIAQQVTSTYTVVTSTYALSVSGTFSPPALTTVTFNGTAQPTTVVASTVGVINSGVPLNEYQTNPSTTIVVASTVGVINSGAPLNEYQTNPSTVTFNGIAQQVTSTSTVIVGSTVGVINSGIPLNEYQTNVSTSMVVSSTIGIQGLAADGATPIGNPVFIGAEVSSNTVMPPVSPDETVAPEMLDKFGRMVTMPLVPWGLVQYATATIAANTAEVVLISSAGAANFNHLIGCLGTNTSATNTFVTFRSSASADNSNSFVLGMPANDVPVGFFPPVGMFQKTANAQWRVQANDSVTDLRLSCQYYVSP